MRFAATALLWVVTTVALAVAVPGVWAQCNVVDVDGYAAFARQAGTDPVVQAAAASELATEVTALIAKHGYSADPALVRSVAGAYTASPSFPAQFAQLNRVVHGWIFAGDRDRPPGAVDVAPMLDDASLAQLLSGYHVRPPAKSAVPLTVSPQPLQFGRLRLFARLNLWVSLLAAVVAGSCALLTVAAARSRAKALTGVGVSALLVGGGGWAVIEVARHHIDDALDDAAGDIRAIADAMVDHAESSLHHWLNLTLAAGGVLLVSGVVVALVGGLVTRGRA